MTHSGPATRGHSCRETLARAAQSHRHRALAGRHAVRWSAPQVGHHDGPDARAGAAVHGRNPPTGLDPQSRANLWQHVRALRAEHATRAAFVGALTGTTVALGVLAAVALSIAAVAFGIHTFQRERLTTARRRRRRHASAFRGKLRCPARKQQIPPSPQGAGGSRDQRSTVCVRGGAPRAAWTASGYRERACSQHVSSRSAEVKDVADG